MPLSPSTLASALEQQWLATEGGSLPDSAMQSGDRFAGAVASWFGMAMAAGFPCSTASVRRSQLMSAAAAALQARNAQVAGQQLGLAVASYMAGQLFGAGVASFPVAASVMSMEFGAVFADLDLPVSARAQRMAAACMTAAVSTMVVFPPPMPPAPVS
ncbi:hypothetical protein HPC49_12770 [Pyxidicoccus fallax]|uniref:Uncharacterized protein n=1 Tax=Pyxidicoccus fallax TaxID=394095 RepID=A0A848LEV1_9BACT|nr:hypothetical protein [Pyxidicoccus fallax]NMO15413.1 hypothetical protein [Pyxidicoccus fallax]NPC79108.1 hypothetical protein [Pyxidicoccus fallax]